MAQLFCSRAVISYFFGEDSHGLAEVISTGSNEELVMEEEDDSEPAFEPLEIQDEGNNTLI